MLSCLHRKDASEFIVEEIKVRERVYNGWSTLILLSYKLLFLNIS